MKQRIVCLFDSGDPRDISPAQAVARRLLDECAEKRGLPAADLSRTLVILPGRQAVRAVSACLSEAGPVLSPRFVTPGIFRMMGTEKTFCASEAEQKSLWMDALKSFSGGSSSLPSLFPSGIPDDLQGLSCYADSLLKLRRELALSSQFGSFDRACAALENEPRWSELKSLESKYRKALAAAGLADPSDAAYDALRSVSCFASFRWIVAAMTPDLPPVVKARLEAMQTEFARLSASGTEVPQIRVFIAAAPRDRFLFDDWGCVDPEKWGSVDLPFRDAAGTMHAAADPEEAAALAVRLAPDPETGVFDPATTSITVTDPAFVPDLKNAFSSFRLPSSSPLPVYDPSGVPMRDLRLVPLLSAFRLLIAEPKSPDLPAEAVRQLLRLDCIVPFLSHEVKISPDKLLRIADLTFLARLPDSFHKDNLPDGMMASSKDHTEADDFLAFRRVLEIIAELREQLLAGRNFIESLRAVLTRIFPFEHYERKYGVPLEDETEILRSLLDVFGCSKVLSERTPAETLFLLTDVMASEVLYPAHEPEALEITGFLEMPFRPARRVILCGMNEGLLPESLPATPFLNDALRGRLGLPDNASRYARDCFYLKSLMERTGGNMHFIVCKTGADGTPLRASSFFFSGAAENESLLKRARVLFETYPVMEQAEPDHSSGVLFQAAADIDSAFVRNGVITLSVTQFKSLISSPLRAWMASGAGMEVVDYLSPELSSAKLGTFVHAALKDFKPEEEWVRHAYADDPVLRAQAEKAAGDRLYTLFLKEIRNKLGDRLPLLPMIQAEMWEARLRKTAECLLRDPCEVVAKEWQLNGGEGIEFHGARILGTVDLIEYDRVNRTLRLIDFKTGADAENPKGAHIRNGRFINLQLPLYDLLLRRDETFRAEHPDLVPCLDGSSPIRCGYFSVSQTVEKIGWSFWDEMEQLLPAASRTAELVIDMIRSMHNKILPEELSRSVPYDTLGSLFLPSPEKVFTGFSLCGPPEWPKV